MTGSDGYDLAVIRREVAADRVVSLVLARPDGGDLPQWTPGAHIDLILRPGLERQYSLCGDPAERGAWRIAVLLETEGRGGSAHLHRAVTAGDTLRARGPRNNFPLVEAEEYLFVAGGIGITPLLPMVRAVHRRGVPWRLVYGGRRYASMGFLDELAAYGDAVTVWPEDRHGLIDLDPLLAKPRAGTKVYCCGPEPLIAAVERRCAGWPEGTLHVERFRPRADARAGAATPFVVELAYSGTTVPVRADQTIVEALEAAGVDVVTSCREGTCGTCETPVLGGRPDHRDLLLTPEERAANDTMMICCSRSLDPVLVLDL
jgi:ferredoxin-NADP reductase